MIDLSVAITDPELGYQDFLVYRTTYHRSKGNLIPSQSVLNASGSIHPAAPEMLQLFPEEERKESYIVIYTSFLLSTGENNEPGKFVGADSVYYQEKFWRVVRVKDWLEFGYVQAMAVLLNEDKSL